MSEIRLILSALCLTGGLVCVLLAVFGVYRFRFVLYRMHCASVIDTLGIFLILLGLALGAGTLAYIPKLVLILLLLWIGSPIASHFVCRLTWTTDETAEQHVKQEDRT